MDPLSITTSILTLIGAASKTYGVLQFISHADEEATSLCVEVSALESVLFSVKVALKRCGGNPLNFASIDRDLWRRIDITLEDCREALDELSQLAHRVQTGHSAFVPGLLYRARVAKRLQKHAKDISSYRDRVRMSTWNLQTLLQVIDVSISLASKDSQAKISSQLDLLNKRVQDRVNVSLCLNRSNSIPERRLMHNMEDFLLAVGAFHKAASLTAGTLQEHSGQGQGTTGLVDRYETSSVVSRMPTHQRQEIVALLQKCGGQEQMPTTATALQFNDANENISTMDGPQSSMPGLSLTTVFTNGFTKLAHRAVQDLDFIGAENFMRRAMEYHRNTGIDNIEHRRLRKQLSLSLFFQGRDEEAKEFILDLAEHYEEEFNTTAQLLFALALSLAHDLKFDEAREICERLCQIRCIWDDTTSRILPKEDIFKLLVTCYRQSRDWMSADAILVEVSGIDEDQCVPSALDFILGSNDLLLEFLGDADSRTTPSLFVSQVQSLPIAKRVTRLQGRLDGASIFTAQLAASEIGDEHGDDGLHGLKSSQVRSASQAVQDRPEKHPWIRSAYFRLSDSLKHLAFKRRPHSNLRVPCKRYTYEVEEPTTVRDILLWREGQHIDHGMNLECISGFPAFYIPELDSKEIAESDTTSVIPWTQHINADILNPNGCPRGNAGTGLIWDPLVSAWTNLPLAELPRSNWDHHTGVGLVANTWSMDAPYASPCRPIIEEPESVEFCSVMAQDSTGPWNARGRAHPYAASVLEWGVYDHFQEELTSFLYYDPISNFSSSPSYINSAPCLELPVPGYSPTPSEVSLQSIDEHGYSPWPSMNSIDCPDTAGKDLTNLPKVLKCEWYPDRLHGFSRRIRLLKTIVLKRVKRIYSRHTHECPVCCQGFSRAGSVKPHVAGRHPGMMRFLYPVTVPAG